MTEIIWSLLFYFNDGLFDWMNNAGGMMIRMTLMTEIGHTDHSGLMMMKDGSN
jgi:hypothetical protein